MLKLTDSKTGLSSYIDPTRIGSIIPMGPDLEFRLPAIISANIPERVLPALPARTRVEHGSCFDFVSETSDQVAAMIKEALG